MAACQAEAALSPDDIFLQAQHAWEARAIPRYESFRIPCDRTFLAPHCDAGETVEFTVRTIDGRTFARAFSTSGNAPRVLMQGGYITGPVETPLGFYRALPNEQPAAVPIPNLAPDPLQTIASVTAIGHAYDVELAGSAKVDGRLCYHLTLRPKIDPDRYPLRELWVAQESFEVVQLTYERPYDERHARALVLYRFSPVGPQRIWTVVHIEAQASVQDRASTTIERVSDDLTDVTFPESVPDWYFQTPT